MPFKEYNLYFIYIVPVHVYYQVDVAHACRHTVRIMDLKVDKAL